MKTPTKWTDEAVLAEGRKYASRMEFKKGSQSPYIIARKRGLLDQLYPSKNMIWTDEALLAEGRKYASRVEFKKANPGAEFTARARNLLDQLYPNNRSRFRTDEELLAEGRKYSSRSELERKAKTAYQRLYRRGILDQLGFEPSNRNWSKDEDVIAEGRKYARRSHFAYGSRGAYKAATARNLLDLIDWQDKGWSDNDAIYIWRAVGQHYNGHPVYKIGVTSARLGTVRVEHVGDKSGFEVDLICCEPVQCKATDLEKELLIIGENPGYTGFDGCTEFRALSPASLHAAITIIRQSI